MVGSHPEHRRRWVRLARIRRLLAVIALATLVALAAPAGAAAISTATTFDSDAQGWQGLQSVVAPTTIANWVATGGHPGGYIKLLDTDPTVFAQAVFTTVSAPFTGDFSAAYGGTISFDIKVDRAWATGIGPWIGIRSSTAIAYCTFPASSAPADADWHTLTATLTETATTNCSWLNNFSGGSPLSSERFHSILADLRQVVVLADVDDVSAGGDVTNETVSLDNVKITGIPETTITSAPSGVITTSSTAIAFTSDPGATFECQLDGLGFTPCTSPATLNGLFDGAHTFAVRAIDGSLADPTPATVNFAVDTHQATGPPGGTPTTPGGTPTTPTGRPRLQNVTLTGSRLLFTASVDGTLNLTIARLVSGHHRPGHRCSRKLKHGPSCTIATTVFHTSHHVAAGAGRFTIGRRSLKRGRYRVRLTLTVGHTTSTAVTKTFTVK